ncbi:MAG: TolC family protein [Bdellovibrionota bacterium]
MRSLQISNFSLAALMMLPVLTQAQTAANPQVPVTTQAPQAQPVVTPARPTTPVRAGSPSQPLVSPGTTGTINPAPARVNPGVITGSGGATKVAPAKKGAVTKDGVTGRNLKIQTKAGAAPANTMGIDDYISLVKQKNRGVAAWEISEQAATDRRKAGDIDLVPTFSLNSRYLVDRSQPNTYGVPETQSFTNTAGLQKRFASGTTIGLNAASNEFNNPGLAQNSAREHFSTGLVGITVSQSLWKDFFGESIGLRRERQDATYLLERETARMQAENLLVEAESAFWDYLYLTEQLTLRRESLDRSRKIERWVTRRLSDGIGDRADLMNARALLSTRELQLANAEDAVFAAEQVIRNVLEIPAGEPVPVFSGTLNARRPVDIYLTGDGKIVRRDSLLTALQARVRSVNANEIRESFKPDLVLSGTYNQTSYNSPNGNLSQGISEVSDKYSQSSVGVTFVYLFDTETKKAAVSQAQKEALAAQMLKERALIESQSSWSEMIRRYDEFSRRIAIAEDITRYQTERSRTEQDKLSKGRSITSNVITAEQEAAEAELSFLQLNAEQRKMEARSRLFLRTQEQL